MSDTLTTDEIVDKVIEDPIMSHALLELLKERGLHLSSDTSKMSHHDRKTILRQIRFLLKQRENIQ